MVSVDLIRYEKYVLYLQNCTLGISLLAGID